MSESTEELTVAVQGSGKVFAELATLTGRLSEHAGELSEEAGAHGWEGIAGRMQEAGDALAAAAGALGSGGHACASAATELMMFTDEIPADEVVGHLNSVSSQLDTAVAEVDGAIEQIEEAQAAVTEVGQEGMMQAVLDLSDQVTELHERIMQQRVDCAREQAQAEGYGKRQSGNCRRVVEEDPPHRRPVPHRSYPARRLRDHLSAGTGSPVARCPRGPRNRTPCLEDHWRN